MSWINSYCLPVLAKLQWHLDGGIIKKGLACWFFVLNIRQLLQFFRAKKQNLVLLCILRSCFKIPLLSHPSSWQLMCFWNTQRWINFQKRFLIKQHYRLRHLMTQQEISQPESKMPGPLTSLRCFAWTSSYSFLGTFSSISLQRPKAKLWFQVSQICN